MYYNPSNKIFKIILFISNFLKHRLCNYVQHLFPALSSLARKHCKITKFIMCKGCYCPSWLCAAWYHFSTLMTLRRIIISSICKKRILKYFLFLGVKLFNSSKLSILLYSFQNLVNAVSFCRRLEEHRICFRSKVLNISAFLIPFQTLLRRV